PGSTRISRRSSGHSLGGLGLDGLEFVDTEHLQREVLVEGLGTAGAHLAEEIFLEADLGGVHPLAFRRPVDVSGRDLRLGYESDAAVAHVGEADGIPRRLSVRLGAVDQALDIVGRRRNHGFDHEAGLGHADGNRRLANRWDRDAYADAEDVREFRVALVLVDQDEAARVGQTVDAAHRLDASESRQQHGIGERQFMGLEHRAAFADLRRGKLAGLDLVQPGVGDPLDMAVAHGAFEHALCVAYTVEAEVPDIGLGGDEGHRYAVAYP